MAPDDGADEGRGGRHGGWRGQAGLVILPLVLAAASVPLIAGWIGPGGLYGIRTAATLASSDAWYAANRAGGIAGLAGGVAAFFVNRRLMARGDASSYDGRTLAMAGCVLGVAGLMLLAGVLAI